MGNLPAKALVLAMAIMMLTSVSAQKVIYSNNKVDTTLEQGAQMMSVDLDESTGIRHFVYIIGEETDKVLFPTGGAVTPYMLRYGQYTINDNGNYTLLLTEEIVSFNVSNYHYNIKVDPSGNVHTAFVDTNYSLYYAVRSASSGTWTIEKISDSTEWFAMSPDLDIGSDGEPKIVYTLIYKDNASDTMGTSFSLNGRASVHVTYKVNGQWEFFDMTDNIESVPVTPAFQLNYFPTITIHEGSIYLAYTTVVQQGAESRLSYGYFPEDLSQVSRFKSTTFQEIFSATPIQVKFSRPVIIPDDAGGIFVAAGMLSRGGAVVAHIDDAHAEVPTSINQGKEMWNAESLDNRISSEVLYVGGFLADDGKAVLTWSLRDNFDSVGGRFTYDVYQAFVSPNLKTTERTSVTTSENVAHYTPDIIQLEEGFEIAFIETPEGEAPGIVVGIADQIITFQGGGTVGFFIALALQVVVVLAFVRALKFIPQPDEEEEILPHMINLKDSITRDE